MAIIRKATLEDVPAIGRLNADVQQIHAEHLPWIFKPPSEAVRSGTMFYDLLQQPEHTVFLAEEQGEAVGYTYIRVMDRPETDFGYAMRFALIDQIGVSPQHRGRGYGELLVQAALELARDQGVHYVELSSWAFNTDAHRFFEAQGFSKIIHRFLCDIRTGTAEQSRPTD